MHWTDIAGRHRSLDGGTLTPAPYAMMLSSPVMASRVRVRGRSCAAAAPRAKVAAGGGASSRASADEILDGIGSTETLRIFLSNLPAVARARGGSDAIDVFAMNPGFADLDIDGRVLRLEYGWIDASRIDAPLVVFLHEGLGSLAMWRDFP